jgi:hypothetical protein
VDERIGCISLHHLEVAQIVVDPGRWSGGVRTSEASNFFQCDLRLCSGGVTANSYRWRSPLSIPTILQGIGKRQQTSEAVPVQKLGSLRMQARKLLKELADILQDYIKRGEVPAWTARYSVTAQIEPDQRVA